MMEIQKKCPKCNSDMVRGYMLDFTEGAAFVPSWHDGSPKKAFLTGTKVPTSDGIPVAAFRCSYCGLIEFYADEKFKPV